MKTIGFFNSKGGVGKTTLVYHIAWMLSEMGVSVIAADFDPQMALTDAFLSEGHLEELLGTPSALTVARAIQPLIDHNADVVPPLLERISDHIGLLVGDLGLLGFENAFAKAWSNDAPDTLRITGAFHQLLQVAEQTSGAELALVDLGSGGDAITRAAVLACDYIVMPLLADQSSLHGLFYAAGSLRLWRVEWSARRESTTIPTTNLPAGSMEPVGYVIMRNSARMDRAPEVSGKWLSQIPKDYANWALSQAPSATNVENDPNCLAVLKDFRSLMPLAREARKPMFLLKPADGAFGGHQQAVLECYKAFRGLTENVLQRCGMSK